MKKLALVADFRKPSVVEYVKNVQLWLENRAELVGVYDHPHKLEPVVDEEEVDYILIFGGDGLFLSTTRQIIGKKIPVMGVNFGKLGFLAEVSAENLKAALEQILAGDYRIVHRMMLYCEVIRRQKTVHTSFAINDGVIRTGQASRMLYCKLHIDREEISTYGGDGVIIATPIGSTAYSLSAGGPIISPELSALVITPICPHTLTMRPLVIPVSHCVEVGFCPPYPGEAVFAVDGQIQFALEQCDMIRITRAEESIYLLETGRRNYFKILQEKFSWGEARNLAAAKKEMK